MKVFIYTKIKKMRNFYIYIKKPDSFQKARQDIHFFIFKNPDTLPYAIFHGIFEIGGEGGGGTGINKKQCTLH